MNSKYNLRKVFVELQVYCALCFVYFLLSGVENRINDNYIAIYRIIFYLIAALIIISVVGTFFTKKVKLRLNYLLIFIVFFVTVLFCEMILVPLSASSI
jgi:hypothetical protein